MRIVVVGAGVIGAAIAEALAVRGAEVVVLDMRSPGRGASHASAGILAPYTEAHENSLLLKLGTRSLAMFDAFVSRAAEHSGRTVEYSRNGTLEVALDSGDVERLKSTQRWLDQTGVSNAWIEGGWLQTCEPAATTRALGGLLVSDHGLVGVSSLVAALVQSARLAGAVFESPVEAVEVMARPNHVDVRTATRRYAADAVVVAAGSWSRRVRIEHQPPLPIRPVRGQLLHLAWELSAPPSRVVWGPKCYTVPWSDGSLLVGATVEQVGFDEHSTAAGVHALLSAAIELLPDAGRAAVEAVRVGLRPATPDGLPAIGPLGTAPRVTIATGHFRNGILLAPLTADLVARQLLDGEIDPVTEFLTPDRFASDART
jgi:glycine oxidase